MNVGGTYFSKYDLLCAAFALAILVGACFVISGIVYWFFVVYPGGYS